MATLYWKNELANFNIDGDIIFMVKNGIFFYVNRVTEIARRASIYTAYGHAEAKQSGQNNMPKINGLLSSRRRYLPAGIEVDLSYWNTHNQDTVQFATFQQLGPLKIDTVSSTPDTEVVNIIVPLKGRLSKYSLFLDHLVENILPKVPQLSLTVVCHHDDLLNVTQELTRMKLSQVPDFKWNLISVRETEFSRGLLRHMGVESVRKKMMGGTLLFFCDVDVHIMPDFFPRCKSNSIQGKQCYYELEWTFTFTLYLH
ncbi:unnamed protein product [Meganyctiphanes norvegica]|uniref:Hexosyltransferase n=1 Tax=Meganyctiphanes norvegica TaxID=48144 RepID=A0AAV2R1R9_MEGNR